MATPELLSLKVRFRANDRRNPPDLIGHDFGRSLRSLALDAIRAQNPDLGDRLREGSALRPYTVSQLEYDPSSSELVVRWTALSMELADGLTRATSGGRLTVGESHRIDYLQATVVGTHFEACESFGDLIRTGQTAALGNSGIVLHFLTPTLMTSRNRVIPLPLPDLVFGSLADRWNKFAPAEMRVAEETVSELSLWGLGISQYQLRTHPVSMKGGGIRTGMVGDVRYADMTNGTSGREILYTLAAFARYAGVGGGVTQGLGQCKAEFVPARPRNSRMEQGCPARHYPPFASIGGGVRVS